MRFLASALLLLANGSAVGQHLLSEPHFQYAAASALSRNHANAFAALVNPAALSLIEQPIASFWADRRFLIPGLHSGAITAAFPVDKSRLGLALTGLNAGAQNQSALTFSFAQTLGQGAAAGLQVGYQQLSTAGYGRQAALGFGVGGLFRVSGGVQAGLHLFQPAASLSKRGTLRYAGRYGVGIGADLSDLVFLAASVEKREGQPIAVQAACCYRFAEKLQGRLGIDAATGQFFIGGGVVLGVFQLEAGTSVHPQLGLSPGLMVLFKPKRKA